MTARISPMLPKTRILIAGHRGLVGSALYRHFTAHGFHNIIGASSAELDLRDARATDDFILHTRPDVVINAAAVVGGIAANAERPADFFSDNLRIQLNLLDSAVAHGVRRLLFLGSSCIYPKAAPTPIREVSLLSGPLEPTNQGFAMAKLAGLGQVTAIRQQHDLPYIAALPTNLYGPNDNFNIRSSHVLPAMIRRFDDAARHGIDEVTCWGTGRPMREFLYVDDMAAACHLLLDSYDGDSPINIGTGTEVSIEDLAKIVASVVGFEGVINWDASKPDGTQRKVLDVGRINKLGWSASTDLVDGIRKTFAWLRRNEGCYRD